jgi:hypothetical protein
VNADRCFLARRPARQRLSVRQAELGCELLDAIPQVVVPGMTARARRSRIKDVEVLAPDGLGYLACGDPLRHTPHDGTSAGRGAAHEDREVPDRLTKYVNDLLDFRLSTDNWIEAVGRGLPGEILPVLLEDQNRRPGRPGAMDRVNRWQRRLSSPRGHPALAKLRHLLTYPAEVCAHRYQHPGRHAITLAEEAKQDMLGADVTGLAPGSGISLPRLAPRMVKDPARLGGKRDLRARCLTTLADGPFDLLPDGLEADPE